MHSLTEQQLDEIALVVVEQNGHELTESEVLEAVGLILENIPGLECLSVECTEKMIVDIKGRYYVAARKNQHRS